ncbi:MAG: DUF1156 domain-containing protein [Bacteroidetes bacterium]|nr:DUF1156 domain-containing protein [Bacteroidota bacterium]
MTYPKRLIEVDFPLSIVSNEARREKNIRSGHIKNLHIWWARRPLTACRAVLCCSLWPDPLDSNCSNEFVTKTGDRIKKFTQNHITEISGNSIRIFSKISINPGLLKNRDFLRHTLLAFVGEFSSFENGFNQNMIQLAQDITKFSAIEMGLEDANFSVVDPFSGGGAIPLESYRLGNTTYANDLNPLPVILNTILLKIAPKYNSHFRECLEIAGKRLLKIVEKKIRKWYPSEDEGFEPIAYLRARTIVCEGPNCGVKIPMIKNFGISKREVYTAFIPKTHGKNVDFDLYQNKKAHKLHKEGTVKRGKVICPSCGFVHKADSVKYQLRLKDGGANDAQLFAVILRNPHSGKRKFRLPKKEDLEIIKNAEIEIKKGSYILPEDNFCIMSGVFNAPIYGMNKWWKLYTNRQIISLNTFYSSINEALRDIDFKTEEEKSNCGISLGFIIGNLMHYNTSVSTYASDGMLSAFIQGQAIPMKWDYAETNPLMTGLVGGFSYSLSSFLEALSGDISFTDNFNINNAEVLNISATKLPLPDDSVDCVFTDPPYYNSVPYADLSDLFLAWYKYFLHPYRPDLFLNLSNKENELCVMNGWDPVRYASRDEEFYTKGMRDAFIRAREICKPNGIISIVFAHKSTSAWESLLSSVVDAGLICTASWPIDTERAARMRANKSAALVTSIHIVCRPRENENGELVTNEVGEWRDVLAELPIRIREWMPRLAKEGVVGADAIFACLGPALEIYSRYSSVEHSNGDTVNLKEYLQQVWSVVAQEALRLVISDADAKSFEEDARITATWLWTMSTGAENITSSIIENEEDNEDENSEDKSNNKGFTIEADTARLLAQGLGSSLSDLQPIISVKGDKATLLSVIDRTDFLFGSAGIQQQHVKKKKKAQLSLSFENVEPEEDSKFDMPELKVEQTGKTVLDRLHQAMLLFSTGRTEALKRFLVEDGVGKDDRFWKLAQSLTSLYPKDSDERRWVEAVQTYKKSLGF